MTTTEPAIRNRQTAAGNVVLSVRNLHVTFPSEAGLVKAVRGLSFDLRAGETMAIVGESGSGKSVTSLAIMGLHPRNARIAGAITLHGGELIGLSDAEMSSIRGEQRAMIAQAIANDPDVIIADEPTTALDVTIQAQVLEVLKKAQLETGAAVIMITHDLGVVAGMSDRVTVMYAGRPVEQGSVDDIFYSPRMPYTIGLLGAVPRLDATNSEPLATLQGNPPTVVDLPPGCPFVPRCPLAHAGCREREPELAPVGPEHTAACWESDRIRTEKLTSKDIFPAPVIEQTVFESIPRDERDTVLSLAGMKKHYPLMKGAVLRRRVGTVYAVDGIDLELRRGETLGLVGESGCGKSTTLLEILNLHSPTDGKIVVFGKDTSTLNRGEKKTMRRNLQVVFQDPMASLDPRMPIFDIIAEPLGVHGWSKAKIETRVMELLKTVGLEES